MSRIHAASLLAALLCAAGLMFAGCEKEAPLAPTPAPRPEPARQVQEETPALPSETTTTTLRPSTYHGAIPPS